MCTAQRIAYDILDKIAVALAGYLKIKKAKKATFDNFWYENGTGKSKEIKKAIRQQIVDGNRGLLSLYDLHRDTTKVGEIADKIGFLRAIKDYRNSSTHRFTVLHDEYIGLQSAKSDLIDHEHVSRFENITLSSIKLARAALFYFCDAINFMERKTAPSENMITITETVADHDYIRGKIHRTE